MAFSANGKVQSFAAEQKFLICLAERYPRIPFSPEMLSLLRLSPFNPRKKVFVTVREPEAGAPL